MTERFFWMTNPLGEHGFAEARTKRSSFARVGPDLSVDHDSSLHERGYGRRTNPLVIEWEPGADEIPEFVWPTGYAVARTVVADELFGRFGGAVSRPVEMVQDPKATRPQRVTPRTKPRLWLPYVGPPLVELWVERWVDIDHAASSLTIRRSCSCGYEYWDPVGHEHHEVVEVATDHSKLVRINRDPNAGLRVRAADLGGDQIFSIDGPHANWLMVTEPVKEFIESREWRNVVFFDMGDIA